MPVPFVILGLLILYFLFYGKRSVGLFVAVAGMVILMLAYLIPNVNLNNMTSINLTCVVGLVVLCVAICCSHPKSTRGSLVATLTICAVYVVLFRVDSDYYSVFNIMPLMLTILIVCMVLCKSVHSALFVVLLSNMCLEIVNVFMASIEGLYAVMFSSQILLYMLIEVVGISVFYGLLHLIKVMRYAEK